MYVFLVGQRFSARGRRSRRRRYADDKKFLKHNFFYEKIGRYATRGTHYNTSVIQ